MGTRDSYSTPGDLTPGTLIDLFFEAVDAFPQADAYQYPVGTEWKGISYAQVLHTVQEVAGGLRGLGLSRGSRAAILSENRPEWALADWGCLCAGVEDIPIYATLIPSQVAYILENSQARVVFVSTADQLAKVQEARKEAPQVSAVVVFDPPNDQELPDGVLSWEAFLQQGRSEIQGESEEAFRAEALSAQPGDVATILYTSGTTGDPKGVMLTHNNLGSNVRASRQALRTGPDDLTLSFLPLSHVFQRMVDYLLFNTGCTIAYARSLDTVAEDLKLVRPTLCVSVPRLYEKVYNKVTSATGVKGFLVQWAREVGDAWTEETQAGRTPGPVLKVVYALADRLVFRKIRAAVGGRLNFFVSGGAPLSPDIARFFYAAGVPILEGYGLTETSPVTNVNTLKDFRIGTVGKPVPGTEIRIAADGEILVRGPQVMKGYLNNPEATREVISEDGWFHTGDIGVLDDDGFLKITDRKKDIIVTAGGKNIAPQPIENRVKLNRYVEQAVMLGDRRKFPSLLLVPAFPVLEAWAREEGLAVGEGREALLSLPATQELLMKEVQAVLADFANFETPKKIGLLTEEFTIEDGSLTPTQKVRRKIVERRYQKLIDAFYAPENIQRTVLLAWEFPG
ncbi:MAG: long-chain fatty acid--CoA ligase [Gemmatimonadota bacterium]